MSQFLYGEILLTNNEGTMQRSIPNIETYPFAFRFLLTGNDFYQRTAPTGYNVVPFVISDGPLDNTAELLLQADSYVYEDEPLNENYMKLISFSMSERVDLIVVALREVLVHFGASECILVLSDGTLDMDNFVFCKMECLAEDMKSLLKSSMFFAAVKYWIKE